MILIEARSDSIMCLQSITLCVYDIILGTMSFACICQCFADIYTLLEVQLQETSGLDKFHMTSKAWTVRTNALSFHIYTCMHAHTHSLSHTNIIYLTLSQSPVKKASLLLFRKR